MQVKVVSLRHILFVSVRGGGGRGRGKGEVLSCDTSTDTRPVLGPPQRLVLSG